MEKIVPEFQEFEKIARLSRNCTITEKIDGTNAQIYIPETPFGDYPFYAGSRNRWIFPEADNFGFARWAYENKEEILKLGPGRHYGEWWGQGIQRGYGLKEKRFSLFNTKRWEDIALPKGIYTVPVLYEGIFSLDIIEDKLKLLRDNGSVASPGFMKSEGVVIFHQASRSLFKKTIEKDEVPKGQ